MATFEVFGMRVYFNVYGALLAIIPALVFLVGQVIAYKAKKPKRVILWSLWINNVILLINVYFAKSGITMEAVKAGLLIIVSEASWMLAFKSGEFEKFYERLKNDRKERWLAISVCVAVFAACVLIIPLVGTLAR